MTEQNKLFLVIWVCAVALAWMCFAVLAQQLARAPEIPESYLTSDPDFVISPKNIWYTFEPKRDITTYELAKILPMMVYASNSGTSGWEIDHEIMRLGTAARHFKRYPTQ